MQCLIEVGPSSFAIEHQVRLPAGVRLPTRMTVIALPARELCLISPVPIDEEISSRLAELGEVRYLVSPSSFHHLYLPDAQKRYPEAEVIVPPGVQAKQPALVVHRTFGPDLEELAPGLLALRLAGLRWLSEVCFFHVASRSLIVADLVLNVQEVPNWVTSVALSLAGVRQRLATGREWRWLVENRRELERSLNQLLAWDFERVIMAHGAIVTEQGHLQMERALAWAR